MQHLPDGEEGRERLHARLDHPEWEHVAIMTGSIRHDELLDTELSLEALVWRVFHEEDEVRVSREGAITRGCRCSVEHYESVIGRFPAAEIDEMRDDDGVVVVDCAFCSKQVFFGGLNGSSMIAHSSSTVNAFWLKWRV